MSEDNSNLGFGKLVPGFDFLQNLAKGASQALPQMPTLSNWVAPTLDVKELEKRIADLKAVHFWLDQNAKALSATIQALEVQKMTLATLQGMNLQMSEVADALKLKPFEPGTKEQTARKRSPEKPTPEKTASERPTATKTDAAAAMVDPLQWWGSLTQQFQQIAANAMKDVAAQTAMTPPPPKAAAAKTTQAAKPARKAAAKRAKKAAH